MTTTWQDNAELAGTLEHSHKQWKALLIARSVEPGEGQSERGSRRRAIRRDEKVSAKKFADHSGVPAKTVDRYLATWDAMADAGIVPPRGALDVDAEVELPGKKAWTYYYREANRKPDKGQSVEQGHKDEPPPSIDELSDADVGDVEAFGDTRPVRIYMKRMEDAVEAFRRRNPGQTADVLYILQDALSDMVYGERPGHAYLRAMNATVELATTLEGAR